MGLLDDAIKEHLDLKRRRGADPAEVERAEQEALGPVRRAPALHGVEAAADAGSDDGFDYDDEHDGAWGEEPAPGSLGSAGHQVSGESDLEPELDDEELAEPEPRHRPRPSRLARIFGKPDAEPEDEAEDDEPPPARRQAIPTEADAATMSPDPPESFLAPEPAPTPPPAPHPAPPAGGETMEYEVERALGADDPAAETSESDEDVLEETPEFLQDTPDHDRLWFEQRPPRDFDFDG